MATNIAIPGGDGGVIEELQALLPEPDSALRRALETDALELLSVEAADRTTII